MRALPFPESEASRLDDIRTPGLDLLMSEFGRWPLAVTLWVAQLLPSFSLDSKVTLCDFPLGRLFTAGGDSCSGKI